EELLKAIGRHLTVGDLLAIALDHDVGGSFTRVGDHDREVEDRPDVVRGHRRPEVATDVRLGLRGLCARLRIADESAAATGSAAVHLNAAAAATDADRAAAAAASERAAAAGTAGV